jgi:hypothetical protein
LEYVVRKAINIAEFISYSNRNNKEEYFRVYNLLLNEWTRILTSTSGNKKYMLNIAIDTFKMDYPIYRFIIMSSERLHENLTRLVEQQE